MYDITNGLTQVVNLLINALRFCFNYLDSFTFNGISLLDFSLGILILGAITPILIGLIRNGISTSERYYKSEKRKASN